VLLVTGATGTIGAPLLRRLTGSGYDVRCLVRDPRRLGAQRVRVQIALGDLADHLSFRHALRGVSAVVHLASVTRDPPGSSIEELAGVATWRLVRAAERAGVERFIFLSTLGAATRSSSRLMRAKAIAERAVVESSLAATVLAPSLVYAPGDRYLRLLGRMSLAPIVILPGSAAATVQPIWAEDVAECIMAVIAGGASAHHAVGARYELAGPEAVTHRAMAELVLSSIPRRRPVITMPAAAVRHVLEAAELVMGPTAFATWDEAQLLQIPMISARGTADAQALGITPRSIRTVLGLR
jgi:NADH dehydrogenase